MLLLILTRFVRRYKEFFSEILVKRIFAIETGDLLNSVKKISIAQELILCYYLNIIAKNVLHLT